jgi:prepilin-type N-terminal cleavage/methylation domain-containing protein
MAAPPLLYAVMPRHRSTRGYSLIEMLTAMALMAILAVIAVPRFRAMGSPWILRQAAQQIGAEFNKARMRAIARNASYRFTYNWSNRTYQLQRQDGGSWVSEYSNQLPAGVLVGGLGSNPTFDSRGMLNADTTIWVVVPGYSNYRAVNVNVLGKVTIS